VEGPDITEDVVSSLKDGALAAAKSGTTQVTEAFIQKIMGEWRSHGDVRHVVEAAVAEIENAGEAAASTLSTWAIPPLLHAIEGEFILAKDTSSLDLLPGGKGKTYRDFAWDKLDYPGGDKGPNEGMASSLSSDLSKIRPERRANRGSDPVLTEEWMNAIAKKTQAAIGTYIINQLSPIPAQIQAPKGEKLNKHALASLEKMHSDALSEGVELKILDAYRDPETSKANAAKADNRAAVAKFSAHNLGLAIDFTLSFTWKDEVTDKDGNTKEKTTKKTWSEATTKPFSNVVGMRESPVHKWLFVRGAEYGWYPYQDEPWHFEYNPTGFRDTFWSEADEAVKTAVTDAKTKADEAAQKAAEKKAAQAAAKKAGKKGGKK
jgi:D-alanyl-D-alanine dipeptidase